MLLGGSVRLLGWSGGALGGSGGFLGGSWAGYGGVWGGSGGFLGGSGGVLGGSWEFFLSHRAQKRPNTDPDSAFFSSYKRKSPCIKNVQKTLVFLWFLYIFDIAIRTQNKKMQSSWQLNLESKACLGVPGRLTI